MSIAQLLRAENYIEAITPRDPAQLVEHLKATHGVKKVHQMARHFIESTAGVSLIKGPFRVKGMGAIQSEGDQRGLPVGSANGCDFWLMLESGKVSMQTSDVLAEGVLDVTQLVELQTALFDAFGDEDPPRGPRFLRVVAGCFGGLTALAKLHHMLPPELLGGIDERMLDEMAAAERRWNKVLKQEPSQVKVIDFTHARLHELPDLEPYTGLEVLALMGNPDVDPQLVFEAVAPLHRLQRIEIMLCGWAQEHIDALRELMPECRIVSAVPRGRAQVQAAVRAGTPLQHLDLSDLDLRRLPAGVDKLTTLERIDLSGNPKLDFEHALGRLAELPELRELKLVACGLRRLPEQLTQLAALETLDLTGGTWGEHNCLQVDEALVVLAKLPKLRHLTLDGNVISAGKWRATIKLLDKHFGGLEHLGMAHWVTRKNNGAGHVGLLQQTVAASGRLESVSLRGLQMPTLDATLTNLPLRRLDISQNNIETLAPAQLEALEELVALGTPLSQLDGLERCRKLRVLEVEGPPGVEKPFAFPDWLGWLSSLERLQVSHLAFDHVPASMGELTLLRELTLSSQSLESLPHELGNLGQLESLTLHELVNGCASLEALPESLGQCQKLRRLHVSHGGLRTLPESLKHASELRDVALDGLALRDPIRTVTDLAELPNLERLSLAFSGLSRIPEQLAESTSLTDVRILDDFGSHAQAASVLCSLPNLRRLDLSRFAIASLPASFSELEQLVALKYETPRTTTVLSPEMLFAALARLPLFRELHIDDIAGHWRELPASIGDLSRLESLTLSSVSFSKLPSEIGKLHNLGVLHFDRCAGIRGGELKRLQRLLPACDIRVTDW